MSEKMIINLENIKFDGNILDVGLENYGIIYNAVKYGAENYDIDYVGNKEQKGLIEKNFYDTCMLFFTFRSGILKFNKSKLIKELFEYIKEEGIIHIWDIDKRYGRIFNNSIEVILPGRIVKYINIKDTNILNDCSFNSMKKLIERYFQILDTKTSNGIYYIKAVKKRSSLYEKNESSIDSN